MKLIGNQHLHIFTRSAFTLIEQNKDQYTSTRPQGRTSRSFFALAANGKGEKSSSLLHTAKPYFTRSAFTLIELLVSTACKIGVLPLYSLKKMSMSSLSENFTDLYTLKFFKKQRQGSKDFSAGKNFDPIRTFLRESSGVRGGTFYPLQIKIVRCRVFGGSQRGDMPEYRLKVREKSIILSNLQLYTISLIRISVMTSSSAARTICWFRTNPAGGKPCTCRKRRRK